MLKFPPLKPHKFPEQLMTKRFSFENYLYVYKMYDLKRKAYTAQMTAIPQILAPSSRYNPLSSPHQSLKIEFLRSYVKNEGYGKKMLGFAITESHRMACDGKLHLEATSQLNGLKPPHRLYGLFGFKSTNKEKQKIIDKWIKTGKAPAWFKLEATYMYYFPKEKQPKHLSGLFKSLKNFFKKIF